MRRRRESERSAGVDTERDHASQVAAGWMHVSTHHMFACFPGKNLDFASLLQKRWLYCFCFELSSTNIPKDKRPLTYY